MAGEEPKVEYLRKSLMMLSNMSGTIRIVHGISCLLLRSNEQVKQEFWSTRILPLRFVVGV